MMTTRKVAVTIDTELLQEVDRWVQSGDYPNRSRAFQAGLTRLHADKAKRRSLLHELSKLDPAEERGLAEEWLAGEAPWPQY